MENLVLVETIFISPEHAKIMSSRKASYQDQRVFEICRKQQARATREGRSWFFRLPRRLHSWGQTTMFKSGIDCSFLEKMPYEVPRLSWGPKETCLSQNVRLVTQSFHNYDPLTRQNKAGLQVMTSRTQASSSSIGGVAEFRCPSLPCAPTQTKEAPIQENPRGGPEHEGLTAANGFSHQACNSVTWPQLGGEVINKTAQLLL